VSWVVEIGDEFEPEFDALHEDVAHRKHSLDWAGAALLTGGLSALLFGAHGGSASAVGLPVAAVLLSLGMGMRRSLGLFLSPVTSDLAVTAADFTLAVAIQNIVWGISQAPVGMLADRFGLRVTIMAGAILIAMFGALIALIITHRRRRLS